MVRDTGGVRPRSFDYGGSRFVVSRGVFDPVRHLSGIAFADQLADFVDDCVPGAESALDLGTGCGLLAATLAGLGLHVIATDVSEKATACATQNCRGLDVQVRHGDMFTPLHGDTVDVAVVNPPYERSAPSWRMTSALTSPDFLERLGAQIHEFAPTLLLGFPADDAVELAATGLDLTLWRRVPTSGRDLGLFVSSAKPHL